MPSTFQGRRRFLKNAAQFSAGLVTTLGYSNLVRASNTNENGDESVTSVVIGSGFGGAVAALRLGQAQISTVLLERGREWRITPAQDTFAPDRNPDGRAAWLSPVAYNGVPIDVYTGVLEIKEGNGIAVACGAGVGGGSLVYNTVTNQPTPELFYRTFPAEVDYGELDRVYFPRVRSILRPSPIPADILNSDFYLSARSFLSQAINAKLPYVPNFLSMDWDIVRQEIAGTRRQSTVIGDVFIGINSGAKNSLDRNYLLQAQQTGFVEIRPLHVVTEIAELPGQGYRVLYSQINERGEVISRKSICCRYLFLAAGAMGTSELLVKARAKGTLPNLNEHIGQDWSNNGDFTGLRTGLPPTNPVQGGPAYPIWITDANNPIDPIYISAGPTTQAPEGTQDLVIITIPKVRGSFKYDGATDLVTLDWPADSPEIQRGLKAAEFTTQTLDQSNTNDTNQPRTQVVSSPVTVYPLGGAVLGKACDLYGRVEGYRGLYVVDSALIPGGTGCFPPSLTIAAVAERCMDRILAQDLVGRDKLRKLRNVPSKNG